MTNETPVVRLGDVRQWLRAGDRFRFADGRIDWQLTRVDEFGLRCTDPGAPEQGACGVDPTSLVRLISPRWERVNRGEAALDSDVLYAATEGVFLGSCRKTVPRGEPVYRLVRARLATRKDVRVGMRVRFQDAKGKWEEPVRVDSIYDGVAWETGKAIGSTLVSSAMGDWANHPVEILAEAPEQGEQLPRAILPKELEVGDMFQRIEEPRVTWLATGCNSGLGVAGIIAMRCVSSSAPGISVGYIGSQSREDWQKLTLLSRGNEVGHVAGLPANPHVAREIATMAGLRHGKTAEQQARRDALEAAYGGQPASPFSFDPGMTISPAAKPLVEEFGSVTWTDHAKCEELWPQPKKAAEKPTGMCQGCKAPFWSGGAKEANYARQLCADCSLTELSQPAAVEASATPHAFPLSPAARYHLADDTGWSTSGWEA